MAKTSFQEACEDHGDCPLLELRREQIRAFSDGLAENVAKNGDGLMVYEVVGVMQSFIHEFLVATKGRGGPVLPGGGIN